VPEDTSLLAAVSSMLFTSLTSIKKSKNIWIIIITQWFQITYNYYSSVSLLESKYRFPIHGPNNGNGAWILTPASHPHMQFTGLTLCPASEPKEGSFAAACHHHPTVKWHTFRREDCVGSRWSWQASAVAGHIHLAETFHDFHLHPSVLIKRPLHLQTLPLSQAHSVWVSPSALWLT
jgi:hypothetical protein